MEGRVVPGNPHAHITLLFSFLPLSASVALVWSPSLSRADSLLLHLHIHAQPCPHAAPTQRFRYQGPGCQHRGPLCRSQHGLDVKFITLFFFTPCLFTLLSYSITLPVHSQSTPSPAPSPAPSHAPGHLLRRPLNMFSALLLLLAASGA